jgi:hypothetical protein
MKCSPPAKQIITRMTNTIAIMPVGRSKEWVGPHNESAGDFSNGRVSSYSVVISFPLTRSSHSWVVTVHVALPSVAGKGAEIQLTLYKIVVAILTSIFSTFCVACRSHSCTLCHTCKNSWRHIESLWCPLPCIK